MQTKETNETLAAQAKAGDAAALGHCGNKTGACCG